MKTNNYNIKIKNVVDITDDKDFDNQNIIKMQTHINQIDLFLERMKTQKKKLFEKEIEKVLEEVPNTLNDMNELYTTKTLPTELKTTIDTLNAKHRLLESKYYSYKFTAMRDAYQSLQKSFKDMKEELSIKTDELEKQNSEMTNKAKQVEENISNIGFNVLGLIVSFSIVSSVITAIGEIDKNYIPLFIITSLWLGMTFLVFVNSLFNKEDIKSKQSQVMYIFVTFLTIAVFITTVIFMYI